MRKNLLWLAACTGGAALVILFFAMNGVQLFRETAQWMSKGSQTAAVFFTPSITIAQIQSDYRGVRTAGFTGTAAKKVRILIVPGHQPDAGGAKFGSVQERDVVVDIADKLAALLEQNPHYEVMAARTKTAWNPILQNYFDTQPSQIEAFMQSQSLQMANHLADGSLIPLNGQVHHNAASAQATFQLYGINKWASDNGYDITLHLHINDDADRRARTAGAYGGFAIYVPDRQYSNAEASVAIAEAVAVRLNAYHATSTLPIEDVGIVPDQKLISVGSNNSATDAALLIEYGYIYEPQFQESSVRPAAVADYAYQTYLGLQDFFKDSVSSTYGSISFPYDWTNVTGKKDECGAGIYALQSALHYLGYYPPSGKSFSECPVSGVAGDCTHSAIIEYQRARGLEAIGILGSQTRSVLAHDIAIHR